ncbi:TetR/AcrR family transcriptional regulator [Nocardia sp. NPDC004750]
MRIARPKCAVNASTRRRAILRAAARLGSERGLEHVQMSDVAASAGVALGTLYRYYPSKHHLFSGLLEAGTGVLGEPGDPHGLLGPP